MKITRGVIVKAQKIVIYGPEGIGKSSFASDFPEPLFIDTEGSTNNMNVARLPRPTSWSMLVSMIKDVKNAPGCCKTLIIDTIDWAEQLCVESICAQHGKKGVEDFGYGNGYVYVKEEFGRILNLLQDVVDQGINVVLTAHSQIRKFEQPDEAGSYDRYELKLGKKTGSQTSPLVKEWADMVLFANYKTIVVTMDKKRKAHGGERVMYTVHHPSWDAKNRHDLAEELPLAYNAIAACIPNDPQYNHTISSPQSESALTAPPVQPPPEQPHLQQPVEVTKTDYTGESCSVCGEPQFNTPSGTCCKNGHGGAPPAVKIEDTVRQETPKTEFKERIPRALDDLMVANQVTVEEIKKVVSSKGYYPIDTLIENYDPGFIDGVLVGAWEQVFSVIKEIREVPFQ